MENSQVSQIRFSGFNENWKQSKLGDIGSVSMCKRIFKSQTTPSGEIPFYKIGTFGRNPDSFISRQLFNEFRNKYPYPEIGDVLISASGTIGRTVVYNGEEAYYQDSNIVWLKRNKELVDNTFLEQFYQIVKWAGTEGSTIKRLYNNNILSTEIFLPPIKEQTKIGEFFTQLDETISLHQQELDTLKQTKQGFLQKMFPKDGESMPELRFPGFADEWKQLTLDELAKKVSVGIATSSSEYFTNKKTEGSVPFIKNKNIKISKIDDSELEYISKEFDQANISKRVTTGDILTVRTGYPGLSAVVPSHLNGAQTFTTLITRLKGDQALPEFVVTFINSNAGIQQITGMEAGGAQKNVNAGVLKSLVVSIPSLDEQKAIFDFFNHLNEVITLQQQELDALKQTKKAFLQKMFV